MPGGNKKVTHTLNRPAALMPPGIKGLRYLWQLREIFTHMAMFLFTISISEYLTVYSLKSRT